MHTDTLQRLFRHKAWANEETLRAMAQLDGGSTAAEMALRLLNHAYIVDQVFAANMQRKSHPFTSVNSSRVPRLEALSEAIKASDQWYIDYVSALDGDKLTESIDFMFTDGDPGRMSREEMLMHVITHGGGHRAQIGWIMMLNSVTPPAGGFTSYLHQAEALARRRLDSPKEAVRASLAEGGGAEVPPAGREFSEAPARQTKAVSRLEDLTARMQSAVGQDAGLGRTLKFDLKGEGFIFIDGGSVTNEDKQADLTLRIAIDDLRSMGQGKLSPLAAVMSGRLGVSDMGVAASLRDKMTALFSRMPQR